MAQETFKVKDGIASASLTVNSDVQLVATTQDAVDALSKIDCLEKTSKAAPASAPSQATPAVTKTTDEGGNK